VEATDHPHLLDATMFWSRDGVGGVRQVLHTKREALRIRGWRHTLMAPAASGPDTLDCGGVPIPFSGGYRFVLGRGHAARLIEQAEPDLIEAADPYTLGWAALDAARALQVPAVAFCHSNLPQMAQRWLAGPDGCLTRRGRWAERQAGRYLADLYGRYDLVLAPNRELTQSLHSLGVPQARLQPLGVDCSVFAPRADDPAWRHALLQQLNLASGTKLIIYAGRFAPEKNLDLTARAVALLGPGHALLAVGRGPRPPRGPGVHLLEPPMHRSHLARLLASADVFVHAGEQETFGLAALEAMACGTPVVASGRGGLGELVQGAGITLRSRRAADWAEAIREALEQTGTTRTRDALARARSLDWPLVIDGWERQYQRLLQPRRRPDGKGASSSTEPLPHHA
jgi:alpha-1,6-mannosyltransferase